MKPTILRLTLVVLFGACADGGGSIQYEPIPPTILTPDRVETRLGTLEFFDGYPDPETVAAVYDNLDFQRGVRAFLDALPIASLHAMREGLREVGAVNGTVGIFENLMDSRTLARFAYVKGVGAAPRDDPRRNLTDDPYFTDGLRSVLFFEARPRTLDEVEYLDWDRPPRFGEMGDRASGRTAE